MTRNTAPVLILAVGDHPVLREGTASLIAGLILLNCSTCSAAVLNRAGSRLTA